MLFPHSIPRITFLQPIHDPRIYEQAVSNDGWTSIDAPLTVVLLVLRARV